MFFTILGEGDIHVSILLEKRAHDGDGSGNGTINAEPHELAFLHDVDHPLTCDAAAHKGSHEANGKRQDIDVAKRLFALSGLEQIEESLAKDGRYDHEERELCKLLFLVAEEQTCGDGAS